MSTRNAETEDLDWRVTRTYSSFTTCGVEPSCYKMGTVFTSLGMVAVYYQMGERTFATFRVLKDGRCHVRMIRRQFTERGMSIAGAKFIRELYAK